MNIVNFTPVAALTGGAIIGLAAAAMWWLLGRISGISGILGNAIGARGPDLGWRLAFIAGLLTAGVLTAVIFPGEIHFDMESGYLRAILAGLLVGFGTQLGSGCTSGHGVCGISRLSLRSMVATVSFMAAGILTVFVMRQVL
jgi:uncharacterized membrane protein YedE/YeeE